MVTDRSQGGSSIDDGSIEIMLHRRTLNDDNLGVGEPLNEKGSDDKGLIVKGTLNLIFDSIKNSSRLHRQLAHEINSKPIVLFDPDLQTANKAKKIYGELKGNIELPANLHLLSLMRDYDRDEKNVLIVRIEHFYEIGEDDELSQPVTICIRELFKDVFNVIGVQELALGANMPVEELDERLTWNADANSFKPASGNRFTKSDYMKFKNNNLFIKRNQQKSQETDGFMFTFKPMQIRTFHVWFD